MSPSSPDAALLACPSYERALVEERVAEAFMLLGGPASVVRPGESVFVKVNLVVPMSPDRAVTTHPEVVRAVVGHLQSVTDRVVIGESPGGPYNRGVLKRCYERTGMARVADETGAALNFDVAETQVALPGAEKMKRLVLCRPVVEADRVVSISKLKTHVLMGLTGAIKNHYGCVPGMQKFTYHSRYHDEAEFADLLVDVALAVGADFHVVDAVDGMEGNGSVWGTPRHMGMLAAGRDPFALDCLLGSVLGVRNDLNLPLAAAIRRGLFHGEVGRLEVAGDDPAGLKVRGLLMPTKRSAINWLPSPFMRRYSAAMHLRPYVNVSRCTGCGKCEDICPAHAISVTDGAAAIEASRCIRCYCCHELCEYGGIDLARPALAFARRSLSPRRS
jgi:uncharacterized protein (DUF362 family)/NAD-dependent dihydropyrimidine dehydrogenase PreA subunit